MSAVICFCGSPMVLRDSEYGTFFSCSRFPDCTGTHSAHPDGSPMGYPGDKETRQARRAAHAVFDPVWRECLSEYADKGKRTDDQLLRMARRRCYLYLAHILKIPADQCHIGSFDKDTCRVVADVFNGLTYAEVRQWFKRTRQEAGR